MSTESAFQPAAAGCQAQRCSVEVPAGTFMCPPHWSMVPPPLREALTVGHHDAASSPEYRAIAQAAVDAVAHKERRAAPRTPRPPRGKPVQLALFDLT